MQVNQFIHFLDDSNELSSVSESEISAILKEFPYCQTGQLMSAIHLNLNNSILFEEQLKRAAAICSDRSKLFEHIHQGKNTGVIDAPQEAEKVVEGGVAEVKETPLEDEKLTKEVQLKPEIQEVEKVVEGGIAEVKETPLEDENLTEEVQLKPEIQEAEKVVEGGIAEVKETPLVNENLTEEVQLIPEIKEEEKQASFAEDDELRLLEKEYLTAAISNSILLEADQSEEVPLKENKTEKEIEFFDEDESHSFSSWIRHYNEIEHVEETSLNAKPEGYKDIIERFIQEDPRIKPKKTNFYSPTNMARISVTDSGLVSETLALIHVDQGSFQEAIDAYEKLMLKNPNKKSYFASQIKILKQKLK